MSGAELRFLRKEARLKPQEFADRLGVDARTVPNWEKSPKLSRQVDILVRLTTVGELWHGEERAKVLEQLTDLVKYEWEPSADTAQEAIPEEGIAALAADNVAYGLNENCEWGIAA